MPGRRKEIPNVGTNNFYGGAVRKVGMLKKSMWHLSGCEKRMALRTKCVSTACLFTP